LEGTIKVMEEDHETDMHIAQKTMEKTTKRFLVQINDLKDAKNKESAELQGEITRLIESSANLRKSIFQSLRVFFGSEYILPRLNLFCLSAHVGQFEIFEKHFCQINRDFSSRFLLGCKKNPAGEQTVENFNFLKNRGACIIFFFYICQLELGMFSFEDGKKKKKVLKHNIHMNIMEYQFV
jgi:hypothetical protein